MSKRKGSILILSMFLLTVVTLLGGIFLTMTVGNIKLLQKDSERQKAFWIAKAGIAELIYNLRQYYNLYEQYSGEKEFGGGKYRVGSATLIGRGYHNTLAVSVGQYPLESTDVTNISKYALIAEVSMNTSTDYLHFSDIGVTRPYYRTPFAGPVHVNGDCIIGRSWGNEFFVKSKDEYGPALEVSGKLYNAADWTPGHSEPDSIDNFLMVGEGTIPVPFLFDISNYTAKYYVTPVGPQSGGWPGWISTHGAIWPYNANQFGDDLVVKKERADWQQ